MKPALQLHGVRDANVTRALQEVPREEFVSPEWRSEAYSDRALPIDCGQTISQPAVVAFMTSQLGVSPTSRVLEIGTGSGYQAAVLSRMAGVVFTVERIRSLADAARDRLARLGYINVRVRCSDGNHGWPDEAPFDAIMVTAATERIPEELVEQLVNGGRLIAPVGPVTGEQQLELLEKSVEGDVTRRDLWAVRFVPLLRGVAGVR